MNSSNHRTPTRIAKRIRRSSRGQALAEFALLLPICLGIVGGGVDFSRAYAESMTLDSAARNAAEAAAYEATTLAEAQTKAREVACTEAQNLSEFVAGSGGNVATCTQPAVTVTYTRSTTAAGANSKYPLVTVSVTTALPFDTVIPWPFLPDGTWTLGSTQTFSILQGR